ncbi:uncharacterized protein LOC143282060 isoform X3 [Babylonia areolata]|uniref:uncharacterized protein LOC143282060 isoform X3 n=1 Tax=Babylonia areolata TaxID=304850 RepID=UPI003FD542B0
MCDGQVEFTKWGKGVKEMYIEGWKVDNTMVSILCDCCLFLDDLVHLQLWNVGLSPLALCTLASVLPRFQCLNSLILDANPLGDANVAPLIDPDNSKLETLSLRFCQLGDINAQALGRALGTTNKWNSKLLTLNLSNNRITDEGVRHLARGLMTNRTLLVLNLAANDIGDDGAAALAQVLSYFALDHQQDQVVAPKGQVQKTPGLKRLVVHRNAVPADNKVLLQLQHYMRLRDPLHKSPLISLNRNNIPPCAMPPIYV